MAYGRELGRRESTSVGRFVIFTGTTRLANTNNFTFGTLFNNITFNAPAGAFNLTGNAITLGGDIADNQVVVTETIALNIALNATHNVSVVDNAALTLSGIISGSGAGLRRSAAPVF